MNEIEGDKPKTRDAGGGSSPAAFSLSLLGTFRITVGGQTLPSLHSRRGQWLLAYLALRGGAAVSRDTLAATFWPESHPTQALYNLRRTLSDLRHAIGTEGRRLESPDSRTLHLDLTDAEVDVLLFDRSIRRGDPDSLAGAVALYQGTLLPGCAELWITPERVAREQDYIVSLERLAEHARNLQDWAPAAAYLRRLLAVEPERESATRALLELLHTTGDNATALTFYRDYRIRLQDAWGLQPSPEIRALYERIKARAARDGETGSRPLVSPPPADGLACDIEPAGGAVPLNSAFYIERGADSRFFEALSRGDSIVLLKGPRQVGKTSLLARGLQRARNSGFRVVVSDLQKIAGPSLQSISDVLLTFARQFATALNLEIAPESVWSAERPPNENFERFLRRYILTDEAPALVWALDEVDRLFPYPFNAEIFGLFRSWHNERALDPDGPWGRLTLAMAYATEAYLFITDLNQSPFNVGTRLTLEDFTEAEVATLNQKYGRALATNEERHRFRQLVGGHPYLVRRGLQELASDDQNLTELEVTAPQDNGPYSDHLRRLLFCLRQDAELVRATRHLLFGGPPPTLDAFYRLRSAGLLRGETAEEARIRCGLYVRYLERRL